MTDKKSSIAAQVEQEHACLKRDMGDIEEDVMQEVSDEEFADWRLEFMWRLRDLRNHLCKHFDLEEEGGFMTEIKEEAPEAIKKVEELETAHGQILIDLDEILAELKSIETKKVEELVSIKGRVRKLMNTLRAHESAENEMMQSYIVRSIVIRAQVKFTTQF